MEYLYKAGAGLLLFLSLFVTSALGLSRFSRPFVLTLVNTTSVTRQANGARPPSTVLPTTGSPIFRLVSILDATDSGFSIQSNAVTFSTSTMIGTVVIDTDNPRSLFVFENANGSPTSYLQSTSSIYYIGQQPDTNIGYETVLPTVDVTSFSPIYSQPPSEGPSFAKDGNKVFFDDEVIPGADPGTFALVKLLDGIPTYYQKDARAVYFCGYTCNPAIVGGGVPTPVIGADPGTIQSLPSAPDISFAADHTHVYYYGQVVPDADPNTFALLCEPGSIYGPVCTYAKDSKHVYHITSFIGGITILAGADPSSFSLVDFSQCNSICAFDAYDKYHDYMNGNIVQAATAK